MAELEILQVFCSIVQSFPVLQRGCSGGEGKTFGGKEGWGPEGCVHACSMGELLMTACKILSVKLCATSAAMLSGQQQQQQ